MNKKVRIGQIALVALPLITILTTGCALDKNDWIGMNAPAQVERIGASNTQFLRRRATPKEASAGGSTPSDAKLVYRGGPVISSVKVWTVFWNASVPDQSELVSFYEAITASSYFDWLAEYNTDSQQIGRGAHVGSIVDTGAPGDSHLTDEQIQNEIARLIKAGDLPPNDANNLYMVHLPPGVSVDLDSDTSCVQFCAYHGTFKKGGEYAFYGVIPDLSGGCDTGCGEGSKLENTTAVSSHELVEAVTDPAVGVATSNDAPLAWYDTTYGEIGDICNAQHATVAGYTVQKEFSNSLGECIAERAAGGGCAHPLCSSGGKLDGQCDPCAATVCAADAYCCSTRWDATCIDEAGSLCDASCD